MEVVHDREKKRISISQHKYIEDILNRFSQFHPKEYATPLAVNHNLRASSQSEPYYPGMERFPELVGSLMYLMVCTRPDFAHVLSVLGSFVAPGRHGEEHWKAALRALGYVKATRNWKLTLGQEIKGLEGFTDASWADDKTDRRSSQGYCFNLGTGAISWKGTKSPAVALSSCEAELYAGTSAAQELLWLKGLLYELGFPQNMPLLWCDNKSTIAMTKNAVFSARSKHIEARYFFIRELVQEGNMKAVYIPTEDNVADIFTKPLGHETHLKFAAALGLA
jgi:hypothetical protein